MSGVGRGGSDLILPGLFEDGLAKQDLGLAAQRIAMKLEVHAPVCIPVGVCIAALLGELGALALLLGLPLPRLLLPHWGPGEDGSMTTTQIGWPSTRN